MKNLNQSPFLQSIAIVIGSLGLGILFDYLFHGHVPGVSFPLFVGTVLVVMAALSIALRQRLSARIWWLAIPLLSFAAMVAVRASAPLTLLNIGACLMLLLLIAITAFRRRLTDMRIMEYLYLPLLPLRFFQPALRTASDLIAAHQAVRNRPLVGQILKGIALTIPVLTVFLVLFASADLVVQKYLTGLFNFHLSDSVIVSLILVSAATAGFVGAFAYIFGRTEPEPAPAATPRRPLLGSVESSILLGSINALFLGFILVQLAYLFGGVANLASLGFTYAEYARKGFFELLAVAVVAFMLLWLAEKYIAATDKGHTLLFRILASALIAQVIIVMASAFRRLYLYEQAYGFTTLRLYSHAFTILLAVIFLVLAYKILRSASDQAFAFPAFLAFIAFLVGLNLINPDAFIARQNLARFDATGKIDAAYLSLLSSDAFPVLKSRYQSLPPGDQKVLAGAFSRQSDENSKDYRRGWQSWNLSRSHADR